MLRRLRRRRAGFVQALAVVALSAMFMRALAPAGFMLSPAQDGRFLAVTLCTGYNQNPILMDLQSGAIVDPDAHKQGKSPADNSHANAPCVFAMAAPLAAPEATPGLHVSFHAVDAAPSLARRIIPGRGLAAPPPWSTGPPDLA